MELRDQYGYDKMTIMNIPEDVLNEINKAVQILKKAGCSEVYLFGSYLTDKYRENSDIDLAVRGLRKELFFSVYGELMEVLNKPFDLICLDYRDDFSELINRKTPCIRIKSSCKMRKY